MAQILVRNLDEAVKQALKHRAKQHGRSMEEEARLILSQATAIGPDGSVDQQLGLGSRIAALFEDLDWREPIPSWHGEEASSASFEP